MLLAVAGLLGFRAGATRKTVAWRVVVVLLNACQMRIDHLVDKVIGIAIACRV